MSRPKSTRQRLLGFGPMGWIAAAVFLAVVATQIAGPDLVVQHVNAIHEIGGEELWDAYFRSFYLWLGDPQVAPSGS